MRNKRKMVEVIDTRTGKKKLVHEAVTKNASAMKNAHLAFAAPVKKAKAKKADPVPEPPAEKTDTSGAVDEVQELKSLRKEYERLYGKKVYNQWTADQLREKIKAAQ